MTFLHLLKKELSNFCVCICKTGENSWRD